MAASSIEIALWPRGPQAEAYFPAVLHRYYQQNRTVQIASYWMNAQDPWRDVKEMMMSRSGADVTEVGESWVEGLVANDSLRPFSVKEFELLGGKDAFIMPAWKSQNQDSDLIYSIPQMTDARHIYYRRDLLAQAGVDEKTAFASAKNIVQTLESLKSAGIQTPLIAPIASPGINLSFLASWVWSAGGDFIDAAGTRANFHQPAAIEGIMDYFDAMEYIPPEHRRHLDVTATDAEFCQGNAAITLSGSWLYHVIHQLPGFELVKANFGMALPAGQACCGGTHLVIWKHSAAQEAAFNFVRFLASAQVQADLSEINFVIPARLDANNLTPYANDPNYQVLVETIRSGRSYGASPIWNTIEDPLSRALAQMMPKYFATPKPDKKTFLTTQLTALAQKFNLTLGH